MQFETIRQARQIVTESKSQMFRRCWAIARSAQAEFGGSVQEFFTGALIEAYARIRAARTFLASALVIRIRAQRDRDFRRAVSDAKRVGGEFDADSRTWTIPGDVRVDWRTETAWQLVA